MRFGKGDREDVHWMIAQEIPALRRYAYVLMRKEEKRDDLVQDTLERAINKSHTWRREGSIKSWLYRIQYSVFINKYCKSHIKEVDTDGVSEDLTPMVSESPNQELTVECKRVLSAIEKLKPRHREVLMLVAVEGATYDQAAAIMDIPVGTVRSRLVRAREDLRAEMKKDPKPKSSSASAHDLRIEK
ncbi:MAG: RNA polymerase sigma factor [Pseudomonadota bacterium]